jgi:glycerophosphoryl diester phosphodiesterase
MRISPFLAFLALILASLAGPSWGITLNAGHRGYSAAYPENTLAALNAAFDVGADMVEFDLQKSQDGYVVLMHDDTVDRTTDGTGPVDSHTLAELQALDAGSWFDPVFAGEPVPTLEEALLAGRGRGALLLDQKSGLTFGAEIAAAIATTAFPVEDLWVTVWDEAQVTDIQAQPGLAGVRILWTEMVAVGGQTVEEYLDHKVAVGVDGISVVFENYSWNYPTLLPEAHSRGLLAFAWNWDLFYPETPEKMELALQLGLDGYIVNDPELFSSIIPEPSTALLFASGLAGLAAVRRRRSLR